MKIKWLSVWIIVLIVTDQAIKWVIYTYYMDLRFDIIPSLIEFRTIFNTQHSYVNVLLNQKFGVNMGLLPHLLIFLFGQSIMLLLFRLFRQRVATSRLLDWAIIFQVSSMVCALIGNLIWAEGTLDYIYLKPLFIFDLKDVYSNLFIVLFLLFVSKNHTATKDLSFSELILRTKNRLKQRGD